jgi:hypothetical protein
LGEVAFGKLDIQEVGSLVEEEVTVVLEVGRRGVVALVEVHLGEVEGSQAVEYTYQMEVVQLAVGAVVLVLMV